MADMYTGEQATTFEEIDQQECQCIVNVTLHVRIGDSRCIVVFDAVRTVAVPVVLVTSFID